MHRCSVKWKSLNKPFSELRSGPIAGLKSFSLTLSWNNYIVEMGRGRNLFGSPLVATFHLAPVSSKKTWWRTIESRCNCDHRHNHNNTRHTGGGGLDIRSQRYQNSWTNSQICTITSTQKYPYRRNIHAFKSFVALTRMLFSWATRQRLLRH